jgi:hypothetical protein
MAIVLDGSAGITFPVTSGSASTLQPSSSKIAQVITNANKTYNSFGSFTTTSTTPVSIGLSVSITPTNAASKILFMFSCNSRRNNGGSYFDIYVNGVQDALNARGAGNYGSSSITPDTYGNHVQTHIQTYYNPGTTATQTYDIRLSTDSPKTAEIWGYGTPTVMVMEILP